MRVCVRVCVCLCVCVCVCVSVRVSELLLSCLERLGAREGLFTGMVCVGLGTP